MSLSNGMNTLTEVKSQGEIWQKVLETGKDQLKFIDGWRLKRHDEIIFIGCGSTYYLSMTAAKIWTMLTKNRHEEFRVLRYGTILTRLFLN